MTSMPRLRLPRFPLQRNRDRTPGEKRDRLVLVAEVAGFVVVTSIVATFVLMAASSGDDGVAAPRPAVPTITDAGGPEPTEAEPAPAPPPPTDTIAPPAAGRQAEVVAPKPTSTPSEPTTTDPTSSRLPNPDDDPPVARLWGRCSPPGSHAVTEKRHVPLVCLLGRWQLRL
jgi:hypothetical protein